MLAVVGLAAALSACGARTDASGASASEARQLNDAAQSIDVNQTSVDTADGNDEDASQ